MSLKLTYSSPVHKMHGGKLTTTGNIRTESMSLAGFLLSLILWCGVPLTIYCAQFYFSAFVDLGSFIGKSKAERAKTVSQKTTQDSIVGQSKLTHLLDQHLKNRLYLRAGQAIQASYAVPPGTTIILSITQCASSPVIEVFKCQGIAEQKKAITIGTTGTMQFSVGQSGFYNFSATASKLRGQFLAKEEFRVFWQRS